MNRDRCEAFIKEWYLFAVITATSLLWLSWLVSMALSGFTKDIEGKPIGADHAAFYSAAKLIDQGRGERIYDFGFMSEYQPRAVDHDAEFLDAYRNPPFYALLYVPTSRLPYRTSFWIWTAVSFVALWLGLGWLNARNRSAPTDSGGSKNLNLVPPSRSGKGEPNFPSPLRGGAGEGFFETPESIGAFRNRIKTFLLALGFYPVFAAFSFGQNSVLSFGLFCLVFRMLERRQNLLAGAVAGLLLYKPQLLLGLGLWWLLSMRQYWKCYLGLFLTGLFWVAVSVLLVPAETRIYFETLREIAAYEAFMFWNMHNPRAFGTLIAFDNKQVGNIVGLIASTVGIVCFVLFWRIHRHDRALMFAAAIFLTLWASPHTMIYEWTLAVIPAVLLWDRVAQKRADWLVIFAIAWLAFFISTPIARGLFKLTENKEAAIGGWAIQFSVPVVAVLALWTMRVLRSVKQPDSGEIKATVK